MTKFMFDIFIRNQLYINPDYDGELLTINGVVVDTTEQTSKIREGFRIDRSLPTSEIFMAYICNEDSITFNMKDNEMTLSQLLRAFKHKLPVKRHAERVLDQIYDVALPYLNTNACKGKSQIVGTSLIVPELNNSLFKKAFRDMFGLGDTRFIYNVANTISNGNMLDFHSSTMDRLVALKDSYSSYANLIRAMGYPFSDYRRYVNKGLLVSIDLYDNVFVIKDGFLYCMTVKQLQNVLDNNDSFLCQFKFEIDFSNIGLGTYVRLDKGILNEIVEGLLNDTID